LQLGSSLLCFEHGDAREDAELCGTCHAHLHVIPVNAEEGNRVRRKFEGSISSAIDVRALQARLFDKERYATVFQLKSHELGSYSWGGTLDVAGMPSQFLRKSVAEALLVEKWDWKSGMHSEILSQMVSEAFVINKQLRTP